MMKRLILLMMMPLCVVIFTTRLKASDISLVKKQILESYLERNPIKPDGTIQSYLDNQDSDGSWPDIDYASKRNANWPTVNHLRRAFYMSQAYVEPSNTYYRSEAIKSSIFLAIDYWAANNFEPNNFPGKVIYPQENILLTYLNMEKINPIPQAYVTKTQWIINKMFQPGTGTGSNKVWFAGIQTLKALFYLDDNLLRLSAGHIWSVMQFTEAEGIQRDWAFHQHGNQPQFGNYGYNFNRNIERWVKIFAGTKYSISGSDLSLFRNVLLNGEAWAIWDDEMDYNLMGRNNHKGASFRAEDVINKTKPLMKRIDPANSDLYDMHYSFPNRLIGFRSYWRSNVAICRRKNWYASIKMTSNRIVAGESINQQNKLGLHQSDGVLFLQQSGKEFEEIGPLLDWHRLPGTTCDQGIVKLSHVGFDQSITTNDFAGSVSKDSLGLASMQYERNELQAKKSWFFDKDVIVCIGNDIKGATEGDVLTSVQQTFLLGDVLDKSGDKIETQATLQAEAKISIDHVVGFWKRLASTLNATEPKEEGDIFSAWVNHGKSPTDASYTYFIYPNTTFDNVQDKIENRPTIISN